MKNLSLLFIAFLFLQFTTLAQEKWIEQTIPTIEQIKHPLKSDNFNDKSSRTILNRTILDNGFLLIEELWQNWDGSNWMNDWKYIYTYDVNNNMIEELYQTWDGSNWVNYNKSTITYDVNNNMIEWLRQNWDGSNWVNYSKWISTVTLQNLLDQNPFENKR